MSKLFYSRLTDKQIRFTIFIIFLSLFFSFLHFFVYKDINPDMIRINVNKAGFEELICVPYIGVKNAEKILKIRQEKGVITDLKQLKNLRYYKRFKYFLKVK